MLPFFLCENFMEHYVYALRVSYARQPFYIGKGKHRRCYAHFTNQSLAVKCLKNNIIQKAWDAGRHIFIEIIRDELTHEQAVKLEMKLIKKYGRRDLGTGCLANHTDGGDGITNAVRSAKTRARIALAMKRRFISEETRQRMSAASRARKRKPHSEETRRRIAAANSKPASDLQYLAILKNAQKRVGVSRGPHSEETKRKMADAANRRWAAART
jgi:hypothetical protein